MKRILAILLSLMMFSVTAFADEETGTTASGGSGSGGGGGGSSAGMATPGNTVAVAKNQYTVSGTIYLPDGMTAPEGGLDIYGGFGGMSLSEVSVAAYSAEVSAVENVPEYEDYQVIATIPEGQSYVAYNKTIELSGGFDGIYGKFWVYDNITSNGITLSNKQTVSSIVLLETDVSDYSNINCSLKGASDTVACAVQCDKSMRGEQIGETEVYIIADNGRDRYISRVVVDNTTDFVNGRLNLEAAGEYDLYYYIPESTAPALQRLEKGLVQVDALSDLNTIWLQPQPCVSGTIYMPEGFDVAEDITITLSTSRSISEVIIPAGAESVEYIVGAFESSSEYLKITSDCERLASGYLTEEGGFEEYKAELWYDESTSVEDFDFTLEEQYIIKGTISLPDDVFMLSDSYFEVYVTAKNQLTGYEKEDIVQMYSDNKGAEYQICIPAAQAEGDFTLCYDYGSYKKTSIPKYASSPLKTYRGSTSGGVSTGGGSSGGASTGYYFFQPQGLMYSCRFFMGNSGWELLEENAEYYLLSKRDIEKDFTLVKKGDAVKGVITGYYEDTLGISSAEAELQLFDEDGNIVAGQKVQSNAGFRFTGLEAEKYILGIKYDDRQYYYNNKRLVSDFSEAEGISLVYNPVSTRRDIFYENIFETAMPVYFEQVIINDCYYDVAEVRIYDKSGNLWVAADTNKKTIVPFSPFYLQIGDYFVSKDNQFDSTYKISVLTDDIEDAFLFEAEYLDTISAEFFEKADNTFKVNAVTSLKNMPITSTAYSVIAGALHLNVGMRVPVDGGEIIAASYDAEGRLIDVALKECMGEDGYKFSMDYSEELDSVKIMTWLSTSDMIPYGVAEVKKIFGLSNTDDLKYLADAYLKVGETYIYRNGEEEPVDVPPIEDGGVIYTPIRATAEALDWTVNWYDETQSMVFSHNEHWGAMQVGSNILQYSYNGGEIEEFAMPGEPFVTEERTMVPFDTICELFGYEMYTDIEKGVQAIFGDLNKRIKYAYDNELINTEKLDITDIDGNITRVELASLLTGIYEKSTNIQIEPAEDTFDDTDDVDVLKLKAIGVVSGTSENTFAPDNYVTYAEAVNLMYRLAERIKTDLGYNLSYKYSIVPEYVNESELPKWAYESIYEAKKLGFLDGVCYDSIDGVANVSRRAAIGITANVFARFMGE